MIKLRQVFGSALFLISLEAFTNVAVAGNGRPIVTLTRAQKMSEEEVYFNCDHMGRYGCLRIACRQAKINKAYAKDIQYLYADLWDEAMVDVRKDFRACFVRAGGHF